MHNFMKISLLILAFLLVPPFTAPLSAAEGGGHGEGHGAEAQKSEKREPGKPENGDILIGPLTVNVLSNRGYRYLRLGLDVQCENNSAAERLVQADCKQDLIFFLSAKVAEDLLTSAGKMALRQELLDHFNKCAGAGKVKSVYFTEFVFQ